MINRVFFKKELMQLVRTSKIIVLPAVFVFFGMLSPVFAKYMNVIVNSMAKGIRLNLPEATYTDAYFQFFKTNYSLVIIIVMLVFAGSVVDEKVQGQAVLMLTKNLSRRQYIMSKLIAVIFLFTMSYVLATAGFILYTALLFPQYYNDQAALSILLFWVYGLFMISFTVFASIISKTHTIAGASAFAFYILLTVLSYIPGIESYTPGKLYDYSIGLVKGMNTSSDVVPALIVTVLTGAAFVISGLEIFRKQEL